MPMQPKKELTFSIYKKTDSYYDQQVLKILRECKEPLPPTTLRFLMGISPSTLSRVLSSLQRFGLIKPVYKRTLPFYTTTREERK
jgi:DNA-binding MarR family transcriptional regulator